MIHSKRRRGTEVRSLPDEIQNNNNSRIPRLGSLVYLGSWRAPHLEGTHDPIHGNIAVLALSRTMERPHQAFTADTPGMPLSRISCRRGWKEGSLSRSGRWWYPGLEVLRSGRRLSDEDLRLRWPGGGYGLYRLEWEKFMEVECRRSWALAGQRDDRGGDGLFREGG
jgi:hypothetical protein